MATSGEMRRNMIIGTSILIIGLFWTVRFGWLYYSYLFTDVLWYYMFPKWVLTLNIVLGIIGVVVGYKLIAGRIGLKRALIITILIMIVGPLINYIVSM